MILVAITDGNLYYFFYAVTLKEDPVIMGVPGTVQLGEDVILNCTTQPAMPPANIVWFIDGRAEKVSRILVLDLKQQWKNGSGLLRPSVRYHAGCNTLRSRTALS